MAGEHEGVTVDLAGDEDIVVELDSDAPAETTTEEPRVAKQQVAAPQPQPVLQQQTVVDEAATALKQSLENSERGRIAAETTAQAERQRADEATRIARQNEEELALQRQRAEDGQLRAIDSGIENATRELQSAKQEQKRALEAGEFDKAIDAQERVGFATAAVDRLKADKARREAEPPPAQRTTEGRVEPQPQPAQATNAFERYVAGFTPKSQAWLRAHPDHVPPQVGGDAQKNAKMLQAHYAAVAAGVPLESEEYFKKLDEGTGFKAADPQPAAQPRPTPRLQRVQPAAPVDREPRSLDGAPNQRRSVVLTKEQQEMARISFPHLPDKKAYAEYAQNMLALQAEGKLGRLTH